MDSRPWLIHAVPTELKQIPIAGLRRNVRVCPLKFVKSFQRDSDARSRRDRATIERLVFAKPVTNAANRFDTIGGPFQFLP
jgi:hypothetical protein